MAIQCVNPMNNGTIRHSGGLQTMTDPNQPVSFPIIVRFKKAGLMRFIGHLDWQALELAMFIKAGLKIVVSAGPSRRLKIKTSPPTPVAVASNTELTCIQLAHAIYPDEAKRRLIEVCPEGIDVVSVRDAGLLPKKNPFGVIEACGYELDPGNGIEKEVLEITMITLQEIRTGEIPDDVSREEVKQFWGRIIELSQNDDAIHLIVRQQEGNTFHAARCADYLEARLNLKHYPLFTKLDYYRLKPRVKKLFA